MRHILITLLALVTGFQAADAQDNGGGEELIADRLRGVEDRLESINQSNTIVLVASLIIAAVAAGAAVYYGKQLRKQLKLAEDDVEYRLRPVLAWHMFEDSELIRVSGAGERPGGLTIKVVNTGEVAAGDVVAHLDARIVGRGAPPSPRMKRLGALRPGEHVDIHIPMSAEDLASAMGGGTAYVEARFTYTDVRERELDYMVAGYVSGAMSTLFDEKHTAPHGGKKSGRLRHPAAPAPARGRQGGVPQADESQSGQIQSFGSYARSLVTSQGAQGVLSREDAERMLGGCQDKLRVDPKSPTANRDMAIALRFLGQPGDALGAIRRAEEADPKDTLALMEMARILGALGRHDEAIGALRRALEGRDAGLRVYIELASAHTALGEYNEAYDAWNAIAKESPSYVARMGLSSVCLVLRQYDSAILALGDAIETMPNDALAHTQKGMAQLAHGQHEKAVATLERAIDLDDGLSDAHAGLAHAMYALGREEEAARELDLAVRADPGNQKVQVDRGVLMLEMGRLGEARESLAAARRLDPSMLVPHAGAAYRGRGRGRHGSRGTGGARRPRAGRHAHARAARRFRAGQG